MSIFKDKTLLIIGGTRIINEEVIHHFLAQGVQQLRLFSGDEEGMAQLRDALAPLNSLKTASKREESEASFDSPEREQARPIGQLLNQNLRFYIGDVSDPAYLEETIHGVDYVLYAPAMKSSDECERQPTEACDAILNPVNNVIGTALSQSVSKLVVLSAAIQEPLTKVKSLIAALLEKVVVAQGRYLGPDSQTAIICARRDGDLSPLADFAFSDATNADLLVQTAEGINRIPCDNFAMQRN